MVTESVTGDDVTVYRTLPTRRRVLVLAAPLVIVGDALFVSFADVGTRWNALGGVALVMGVALGYMLYRMAYTIVLRNTASSVEFRSVLRKRVVPVSEIQAVAPARFLESELVVTHAHGSERIPAAFPEVHEILAWIRRRNPDVAFGGMLDR